MIHGIHALNITSNETYLTLMFVSLQRRWSLDPCVNFFWMQISDDQAALVFGGTDSRECHDVPLSSSVNFDVIIMLVNYDVDFSDNTRVYMG